MSEIPSREIAIVSVRLVQFESHSLNFQSISVIMSNESVNDLWKQVGRGSSSCRRGLGFFVRIEERPCSEAKHLVARSIGVATSPESAHESSSSSRIPKLLSKNGDSEVLGTFSKSDGKGIYPGEVNSRIRNPITELPVRSLAFCNKRLYLDHSGRQWLGFHKRELSSSATKVSDEQKEALVSRSDEDVGGQGQPPPSQPLEGNLMPTSEEEVRMFL